MKIDIFAPQLQPLYSLTSKTLRVKESHGNLTFTPSENVAHILTVHAAPASAVLLGVNNYPNLGEIIQFS